jgi:hypothetical protein
MKFALFGEGHTLMRGVDSCDFVVSLHGRTTRLIPEASMPEHGCAVHPTTARKAQNPVGPFGFLKPRSGAVEIRDIETCDDHLAEDLRAGKQSQIPGGRGRQGFIQQTATSTHIAGMHCNKPAHCPSKNNELLIASSPGDLFNFARRGNGALVVLAEKNNIRIRVREVPVRGALWRVRKVPTRPFEPPHGYRPLASIRTKPARRQRHVCGLGNLALRDESAVRALQRCQRHVGPRRPERRVRHRDQVRNAQRLARIGREEQIKCCVPLPLR